MTDMAKAYDPRSTEARVYEFWEKRGYFKGGIDHVGGDIGEGHNPLHAGGEGAGCNPSDRHALSPIDLCAGMHPVGIDPKTDQAPCGWAGSTERAPAAEPAAVERRADRRSRALGPGRQPRIRQPARPAALGAAGARRGLAVAAVMRRGRARVSGARA